MVTRYDYQQNTSGLYTQITYMSVTSDLAKESNDKSQIFIKRIDFMF